ncbi:right-handed parallel beta-helix repeat-containing protein [Streptomyces europaeiscabiei]|uniref:right-handed parallel beta-helix repeat-containing protein n=1 Tax=Streptomyces europaeiscabiei TaxID=146819 RepID=UPI000AAB0993|nr:right-handed parallel beta-helix repeat-containing protein [Streptomyces europaeiscabiei]MDX2530412.1 right-handed parallel beta-helix repeat-containing protein [Streptomyces europaeiscabiei]MDX2757679.1 right-handed parallel beta-helix repeat-containing protein [Streptomyces europaeiscabiei]MDX2768692.1 right-handed parallel beta-helix repeat-containing protein [Streptomyces europaeiscabiei]MDX3668363.1 right-handed parallel beta-helix repeat-containing protein [Streptomyces europaeiscabiei
MTRQHLSSVRRTLRGAVVLPLAAGLLLASAATSPAADGDGKPQVSAADAENETALVAAEDHRLDQVRAVAAVAPLKGGEWKAPYRLDTGDGYTLVLTQRSNAYTVSDLLELAPQTFVRQPDGAYLLTENIYLNAGAKLKLSNPGGLTLRMASSNKGFVSIVSFGGRLTLEGTPQAPLRITSWNDNKKKPDKDVRDGRAYIRAIGGQFSMKYAKVGDLGFWSGRTGGLSLTGTDRPDTGNIEDSTVAPGSKGGSGGVVAQPSGSLATPDTRFSVPSLSYVSAEIGHSTLTGNAFGLFLSGANGVSISDSTVRRSLEHGVVLHRFVTNAVVERTVSKDNGGDGFVLARATEQVRVSGSTAEGNGGNGFTLSGRPLASGPSASGESISSYGSNSVSDSTARDNGHYGIEIFGGKDVGVQNNRVEGGDMGIVARKDATKVAITGNRLVGQSRQGISVRDGVTAATITGNIVESTETGIYIRDSVGEIRGNTIQDGTNHGISLVGGVDESIITYNVISGVGPSAVDTTRAHGGIAVRENQTFAWHDTSSFWVKFRHYASPMTLLWTFILLLILISAVLGRRQGRKGHRHGGQRLGRHPYEDKKSVTNSASVVEVPLRQVPERSWFSKEDEETTSLRALTSQSVPAARPPR